MPDHTNWIIVGSPDNFAATRGQGFTIQGIKSRHRKKAEAMRPGDRIVWYITGVKAFAGVATITSGYFEDHTPIWKSRDWMSVRNEVRPMAMKVFIVKAGPSRFSDR